MKEWITGRNPVYEVLRAQRRHIFRLWLAEGSIDKGRINDILKIAQELQLVTQRVPRKQLDALVENHHGIALETSAYPYCHISDILEVAKKRHETPLILILDTLQDPQNLGTLIRSAEAVGVHGILLPLRRSTGVTPAVVQSSAGASEHLLIAATNLAQAIATLKDAGLWIVGLENTPTSKPIQQASLDGPLALVVGSEGEGMHDLIRRSCDILIKLPMLGKIESLNAAVAGSIVLYLTLQTRQ